MKTKNLTGHEKIAERASHQGLGIVIEFVGPPGCGKTTNTRFFADRLSAEHLNVIVFNDVKRYLYGLPRSKRIGLYTATILVSAKQLIAFWTVLRKNGIYSVDSFVRYVKLCIFNAALLKLLRARSVDVVLLDQWSIQGLWSSTIFKLKNYDTIANKLAKFFFRTDYVLYFDVDPHVACDRIALRDSHRSRFDNMDRENRLSELTRYSGYLFRLYEKADCRFKYRYSALLSPKKNAETFLTEFEKHHLHRV